MAGYGARNRRSIRVLAKFTRVHARNLGGRVRGWTRSGKLKLSSFSQLPLFLGSTARGAITKTDGDIPGTAFHNFLTSHSFALTSSIRPSRRTPFTSHRRSHVLPQIGVAKVILFFFFVSSFRAGTAEWLVGKNDLKPAFPFPPSSTVIPEHDHVSSSN